MHKCPPGYLTQIEAAEFLGKSLRTVERWRYARTGPAFTMLGKQPVYRTAALDAWLLAQEIEPVRNASTKRGGKTAS